MCKLKVKANVEEYTKLYCEICKTEYCGIEVSFEEAIKYAKIGVESQLIDGKIYIIASLWEELLKELN
jgi:hypothetical protein